jgi:hypothetical protein
MRQPILTFTICLSLHAAGTGGLTPAQWRQDLRYFQRELEHRHKNAFHFTSREKFEAAVADLDSRLSSLNYDQIYVGFVKLAALIGDAHTGVGLPPGAAGAFPIRTREYGEDFRVVVVAPGLEKALGTRLIKIQDTPAAQVGNALLPLFPQDEHPWYFRALANLDLVHAAFLHGLGITPGRETARYTFAADDGSEFTLDLHSQTSAEQRQTKWVLVAAKNALEDQWEPAHRPADTFSYRYIPKAGAVYCDVRSMRSLGKPGNELLAFIRQKQAGKLIVDLRRNPGGDYFQGLHHLIEPIRKLAAINRKGRLFVLIGPLTGSAAIIDTSLFHTRTEAILVGQPIGAKPTEYAELKQMKLPNSHLVVGYSVRFYQFAYNDENAIRPDHEIVPAWEETKAGRDPVVEWCLSYSATP